MIKLEFFNINLTCILTPNVIGVLHLERGVKFTFAQPYSTIALSFAPYVEKAYAWGLHYGTFTTIDV